jgi:hypothetical protein
VRRDDGSPETIHVLSRDTFAVGSTLGFRYLDVAKGFNLIKDFMQPVIIAIDPEPRRVIARLHAEAITPGAAARQLQQYTVQVPDKWRNALVDNGHAEFIDAEQQFCLLTNPLLYTREIGLLWEEADSSPEGDE